jgi:hypothetical protein
MTCAPGIPKPSGRIPEGTEIAAPRTIAGRGANDPATGDVPGGDFTGRRIEGSSPRFFFRRETKRRKNRTAERTGGDPVRPKVREALAERLVQEQARQAGLSVSAEELQAADDA